MALDNAGRNAALRDFLRKAFKETGALCAFDTTELRAAIDATDDWIDLNAGSFNAALPDPFKSVASAQQKTLLFCYVALKRAGI